MWQRRLGYEIMIVATSDYWTPRLEMQKTVLIDSETALRKVLSKWYSP